MNDRSVCPLARLCAVINRNFIFACRPTMTTLWWRRRRRRLHVLVSFSYVNSTDENSIGPTLEVMHAVELVQFTDCLIFLDFFFFAFLSAADEWRTKEQKLKKYTIRTFLMTSTGHLKCGRTVFVCCCCWLKYFISLNAHKKKKTVFVFNCKFFQRLDTFWHIYAGMQTADGQNGRTNQPYPGHRETMVPTGTCMNLKHFNP